MSKRLRVNALDPGAPNPHPDADTLLQASRRLDWRFLLPDLTLNRVAYVGATQGALLESLKIFAARLDLWETPAPGLDPAGQAAGSYDVVVARAPNEAALSQAVALAAPAGCVYVEAHGLLSGWEQLSTAVWPPRRARLWSLPHYIRTLHAMGMDATAAFWFWPDFERCTKIIPIDDMTTFMQFQMSTLDSSLLRRFLQTRVVQQLVRSRLGQYAVPSFGIVAHRAALNSLPVPA